MKSIQSIAISMILVTAGVAIGWFAKPAQGEPQVQPTVYELRTYTTEPGKLPNLHARFKNHTMKLFEKHGIKNVIYWTPVDADGKAVENKLVYLISHQNMAAAKASWEAFRKDPEWKAAREASESDGKILAKAPDFEYLTTVDYSPMK